MEQFFTKKEKLILGLHYFAGYSLLYQILAALIVSAVARFIPMSETQVSAYNIIIYAVPVFIIFLVYSRKLLAKNWEFFKQNAKKVLRDLPVRFIFTYAVNLTIGIILSNIVGSGADNQSGIIEMAKQLPLLIGFFTVIFAPIVEEIIFREIIQKSLSEKYGKMIGLVVASLIFGFMHLIPSILIGNWIGLIYIVQYGALGVMLGLAYNKNDNLVSSILLHFLNNLIGYLLILLSTMIV